MPATVRALDVSILQPRDLRGMLATYRPAHVVVRLYLPEEAVSQAHTSAQIASAAQGGWSIGGYVWCYGDLDPHKTARDAVTLARSSGVTLPILWLHASAFVVDGCICDPGPDAEWLRAAVAEASTLGTKVGIMTTAAWWQASIPDGQDLGQLPLWLTLPTTDARAEDVLPFGGWTRASGTRHLVSSTDSMTPSVGRLRADLAVG